MAFSKADKGIRDRKDLLIRLLTIVLSAVYILVMHAAVSKNVKVFDVEGAYAVKAEVSEMAELVTDVYEAGSSYETASQYFYAKVLSGSQKGEPVVAVQTIDNYSAFQEETVKPGDKVILYNYDDPEGDAGFIFGGYERLDLNIVLGCVFFALLLLFGRLKGFHTIVALIFTCLAVFYVFVPAVLAGYNVYVMTCMTCVFTIIMTLLITNGACGKSLTTILGCCFGVLVAALLTVLFSKLMRLTGILDEHSVYLQYLSSGVEIDLRALIFGMIVIGALGAVMDVAMDISSSLSEVHLQAPHLRFSELFRSGIRIGRDVMGTMANTLVLAYIGSNLCGILLLITYSSSMLELLNRESIAVELLQALIGSLAILLTIPLTSLVCAALYTGKPGNTAVYTGKHSKREV
jgi:uncharacterized membrane protein